MSNPAVPSTYLGTTKTDWMLGGAYDFAVVKAFASHGQAKAKTTQLGVSVPAGATGKVLASWAQTKMTATDISRKTFTVGYDYFLSKRTDVYVMAMNDRITNQTKGNSFGVGIRHRF